MMNNELSNQCSLGVTNEDILTAMKKIPGYLDITPADFMEIYQVAYAHAVERLKSSIKAEHIMTKLVITIQENASLADTAKILASHTFSGIPVLNSENQVSGIISEKDFLKQMSSSKQPSFMQVVLQCLEVKGCVALNLKTLSAKDIMSSPPISVKTTTPIREVANIIEAHHINRVPVLDGNMNLAGIIARSDLVQAVCWPTTKGDLGDETS